MTENKNTTASIILEQLGGNRFKMMTGANNFLTNGNDLTFSLPGGGGFAKSGINRVNIELTPADLYTVKFYRLRRGDAQLVSEHTDIYCDSLQELFTRETGLATHFDRKG